MADQSSLDEIFANGRRLMAEKEYDTALKNFKYIQAKSEGNDYRVIYYASEWFSELGDTKAAYVNLDAIIKAFNFGDGNVSEILYIKTLYLHAKIDYKVEHYSNSNTMIDTCLTYIKKNKVEVEEDFIQELKEVKKEVLDLFDKHGDRHKSKGSSNHRKQVPYPSTETYNKRKTLRAKPYQRLKEIPADSQKKDMLKLWGEMNENKMDIQPGSKWYVISSKWFNQWKAWTGFTEKSPDTKSLGDGMETKDTEPKSNQWEEPGRIDNEELIEIEEIMLFGDINLKDNLNEEEDYIIVNPPIWRYLYTIYDGIPILRHAIKNFDKKEEIEDAETIIEVNLVKLYIFEVPRENKQDFYEVALASRNWELSEVRMKIWAHKKIKESDIRLWKMEKPSNLEKFYNELEYEWKKYKTLRIEGELFKDLSVFVKDADFSRDDFLMLEYPIPTSNENGYALVEVEKRDIHDTLNERAAKVFKEDEDVKEAISNPKTLKYNSISFSIVTNEDSIKGAWGLSNIGNTWFMNSALQCMSQTHELSKYFCFRMHESEINHTNVLGSKGRVAEAYGELMHDMWIGHKRKTAPFNIKKSIGTVVAQFRGYNQQDSHEFLHYLIDTLNEDLNRVKEKPYVEIPDSDGREDSIVSQEQWEAFGKRNDSVMIDLLYGQMKSHLVCLEWDYTSNTFDPFSILSVPVPVVKIVKLKVTYFPLQISLDCPLRTFEIYVNDNLCLTEVETMIQKEVGSKEEMLFYMYNSNKFSKRIKKNSFTCRDLAGFHLGAFAYKIDQDRNSGSLYILETYNKKQVKKMMFFSGEDPVSTPFILIIDGKCSCRDVQLKVFSFLYPILKIPSGYTSKFHGLSEDELIDKLFTELFEDSTYGEEELYEFILVNNRDSGEICPCCRKSHKGNCKFDFSQKWYRVFLNHGTTDPEVWVLWKQNTKVDLSVFEKPIKLTIGEPAKTKEK